MRVNTFLVVAQFSVAMTIGFGWVLYKHPDMILAYAGLLLTVILGALGLKGWQKSKEQDIEQPKEEAKP